MVFLFSDQPKAKGVFKEVESLMRGLFTWQYDVIDFGVGCWGGMGLKNGCSLMKALQTWKYAGKGLRKSGL